MGLLSNDKTRAKIVEAIRLYHNKLAFLCYVIGLGWFLALAYQPLNARTYFSENALIPGLVESDFYHDHGAGNYYKELKEELKSLKEQVEATEKHQRDESLLYAIPAGWMESRLRDIGLDTYIHNYSFQYPMSLMKDQKFFGKNVYGILRAPKAASTEAVVLCVPYRSMHADSEKTAAGIAVMLGLAKAFRSKTHWAKDIIFLVTEHDSIGIQAWLSAYHYSKLSHIFPSELPGRSGSIQAAINLELGTDQVNRINIKMEGLNGQLPNLDLVNTVVKLAKQQDIQPVIQKRRDSWMGETFQGWSHSVKTMLLMMWHQASGFPNGNHGLFHRYNIEAVTLQGIKIKGARRNVGFTEIGRMLEGIFRSLNNLMERFHQSFFFYLLPATDRYVSIGLYMPPFGLLAAPILIKAVALWIAYSNDYTQAKQTQDEQEQNGKKTEENEDKTITKEEKSGSQQDKEKKENEKQPEVKEVTETMLKTSGFTAIIPPIVMSFSFGLLTCFSPGFFIETASALHMKPGDGLAMGIIAIFIASLMYPKMLRRKAAQKGNTDSLGGPNWKLLKCVVLLLLGVILASISVLNISLAFFITAIWAPVLAIIQPRKSRIVSLLQYLMLIVVSPIGLLYICCVVHEQIIQGGVLSKDLFVLHQKVWENAQYSLLNSVIDSYLFNNWIYGIVTLLIWPSWLVLWALVGTQPY